MTCRVSSARQSQKSVCVCVCYSFDFTPDSWKTLFPHLHSLPFTCYFFHSCHLPYCMSSFRSFTFPARPLSVYIVPGASWWCFASSEVSIFGTLLSIGVLHEHHGYWNLINKERQKWRRLTWLQLVSAQIYIVLGFIYCKCISSVCAEVMWHVADQAFKVHMYVRLKSSFHSISIKLLQSLHPHTL